ncbi:MAG: hypothetical protein ACE14L_15895 [Terriglobales bacterium]
MARGINRSGKLVRAGHDEASFITYHYFFFGEDIMNIRELTLGLAVLLTVLLLMASVAVAAPQTLTGVVTDDMCGKKHTMMPGKPDSECIRACVKAGSKYALLSGDKVYVLKGDAKQFDQLAGKKVKVAGDVTGTTVAVSSIAEAK